MTSPRRRLGNEGGGPVRPAYVQRNRRTWDRDAPGYEALHQTGLRRNGGRAWGLFRVPERKLRLLEDVRNKDVLELGCGAAWWSIALSKDGARAVGLDFSAVRLEQARRRMRAARVSFPLVEAGAERLPFPSRRFDLVLSDYGATTFSDPQRWVPESARVLRKDGLLVFAHASPWRSVTEDRRGERLTRTLRADYFGLNALRTSDTTEFQRTYGEWIRLFVSCGFSVERLVEPSAPTARQSTYLSRAEQRWARHWPVETIWKLRKTDGPPTGSPPT